MKAHPPCPYCNHREPPLKERERGGGEGGGREGGREREGGGEGGGRERERGGGGGGGRIGEH